MASLEQTRPKGESEIAGDHHLSYLRDQDRR